MFADLFRVHQVKNPELKSLADFGFRCTVNTMKEQSAGLSTGLTAHAARRQQTWLDTVDGRLKALVAFPIPDLPATHPIEFECDYSAVPEILSTPDGQPQNSDIVALAIAWQTFVYECVRSNSGGIAGGMLIFDYERAAQNIESIRQLLLSIIASGAVDFPETAEPESKVARPGASARRV